MAWKVVGRMDVVGVGFSCLDGRWTGCCHLDLPNMFVPRDSVVALCPWLGDLR